MGSRKTTKRDILCAMEVDSRAKWDREKTYEVEYQDGDDKDNKYMATFPYPYMNGRLHLGHSFSISKVEFSCRYQRLLGKKVMFPFGFHCTGMPIKACADKLYQELKGMETEDNEIDMSNFHISEPRDGGVVTQYSIMKSLGIKDEEIPRFRDPRYWLVYFPPLTIEDMKLFGCSIDWRRSFITTDKNPFYDSFIRWQFRRLQQKDKIRFGKRYTIYSTKDNQACLDHDRSCGEGVVPVEHLIIKLPLSKTENKDLARVLNSCKKEGMGVYLLSICKKPEFVLGVTNVWMDPSMRYYFYKVSESETVICHERAFLNLSHQCYDHIKGNQPIYELDGACFVGSKVLVPLKQEKAISSIYGNENISKVFGTGIKLSVPSESPEDYIRVHALICNGCKDKNLEYVPFIQRPQISHLGKELCIKYNITSSDECEKISMAENDEVSDNDNCCFVTVGSFQNMSLCETRKKIMEDLDGMSVVYAEPGSTVISRSGDECIVALMDQWYIVYGEDAWKSQVETIMDKIDFYPKEARNQFEFTLGWLREWACSRSFGLGSRIPWDRQYLIESLSDSTIYMAYYTISHILHAGSLDGSVRPENINPGDMTDEVWSYVFLNEIAVECLPQSNIPEDILVRMKKAFMYFYPFDLRVSGKDLVSNHLIFMIYTHAALFKDCNPKAIRVHGYLSLNGAKMSKSTGNFMTLRESLDSYGSDATRISLADSGESLDDANFATDTCDSAILKLYSLYEFIKSFVSNKELYRGYSKDRFSCSDYGFGAHEVCVTDKDESEFQYSDWVFANQINRAIEMSQQFYDDMLYKNVLQHGFYELLGHRDRYREMLLTNCKDTGNVDKTDLSSFPYKARPHYVLICRYIDVQLTLISPIAPHFCEYVWGHIMKNKSLSTARFPVIERRYENEEEILESDRYLADVSHEIRQFCTSMRNSLKKKMVTQKDLPMHNTLDIYVTRVYPNETKSILDILMEYYNPEDLDFGELESDGVIKNPVVFQVLSQKLSSCSKSVLSKKHVPFAVEILKKLKDILSSRRDKELINKRILGFFRGDYVPFDEYSILRENLSYLKKLVGVEHINIVRLQPRDCLTEDIYKQGQDGDTFLMDVDAQDIGSVNSARRAIPGKPSLCYYHKDVNGLSDFS